MADSSKLDLTLEIFHGGKRLAKKTFREESVTIGSGSNAVLTIKAKGVAELHAVINVEADGSVKLVDLGAGSVTMDGEPVTNADLQSGDSFNIGKIKFVVSYDAVVTGFDEEESTNVGAQPAPAEEPEATDPGPASEPVAASPPPLAAPKASAKAPAAEKAPMTAAQAAPSDEDPLATPDDIMDLVMRSGTSKSSLGLDTKRDDVLEVNQMWDNVLLDTKHFRPEHGNVTIGSAVGWHWNFLGVDMGWVAPPLNIVLRYTPPMWSEVTSDWRNHFYAPDTALPGGFEHSLFTVDEEGKHVAHVSASWDGFADLGEKRLSFDDLVSEGKAKKNGDSYEITMSEGLRLMVDVDGVIFFSHLTKPSKRVITRIGDDVDYPFLAVMSVVGAIGLLFGLVMYLMPPSAQNEVVEIPDRFVDLLVEKPEEEEKEKKKPSGNPDAGEGAKAKREEGKTGKKDAKEKQAKGSKKEINKRQQDKQIAENAGVLGALRDGAELDGIFGSSGLNSDITGGIGGLIGAKGTQIGSGGLGSRGSGLGGGGTAEGLGGLGTKGMGSGASGYGKGGGHFGAKGEGGIGTVGGDPIIMGALDRSLIDEVIKRHMNQIRYCYQRELAKNPNLGGKIVIKFVIAKDGTVSKADKKTSTMNNAAVESCIETRFRRMEFPEPKGGGIVIVSYPFLFAPG